MSAERGGHHQLIRLTEEFFTRYVKIECEMLVSNAVSYLTLFPFLFFWVFFSVH